MELGGAARGPLFGRRRHIARRQHAQRVDATAVGPLHAELEAIDARGLAAARQPPELLQQQPCDGVDTLALGELRAEELVELLDTRDTAHGELRLGLTVAVKDGKLTATLNSIDQSADAVPIKEVTVQGDAVHFVAGMIEADRGKRKT